LTTAETLLHANPLETTNPVCRIPTDNADNATGNSGTTPSNDLDTDQNARNSAEADGDHFMAPSNSLFTLFPTFRPFPYH